MLEPSFIWLASLPHVRVTQVCDIYSSNRPTGPYFVWVGFWVWFWVWSKCMVLPGLAHTSFSISELMRLPMRHHSPLPLRYFDLSFHSITKTKWPVIRPSIFHSYVVLDHPHPLSSLLLLLLLPSLQCQRSSPTFGIEDKCAHLPSISKGLPSC